MDTFERRLDEALKPQNPQNPRTREVTAPFGSPHGFAQFLVSWPGRDDFEVYVVDGIQAQRVRQHLPYRPGAAANELRKIYRAAGKTPDRTDHWPPRSK